MWITGSPAVAELVERSLLEQGWRAYLLNANFTRNEWRDAARTLRNAGMVALFSDSGGASHRRDEASQVFGADAFFVFDGREESPAQAASRIVRSLREWRDEETVPEV